MSQLDLKPGWEGRNIDLAVVRRLCDTVGEGCELAVMPYDSESEIAHWSIGAATISGRSETQGSVSVARGRVAADIDAHQELLEDPIELLRAIEDVL